MGDRGIGRRALYDLVWSEPISTLATKYGYSDVGFSKLCRKHGIPLPTRGYWARVKVGKKVRQPPLPPAKAGQQQVFQLIPLSEEAHQVWLAKRARQEATRQSIALGSVAADATKLHPLAKAAQKRLSQKNGWSDPKQLRSAPKEVLDIEVTKGSIERAVLIANVVLIELHRMGATIRIDSDKGRTVLELRDTQLVFRITEHVTQTSHEATPAEQRALERYRNSMGWASSSIEYPRIPQYDYTPTGLLTITARGWPERNWRDTKRTQVDHRLGVVVAGIISLAEEVRDRESESARKRADHAQKVERYQLEMTRRAEERRAYQALRADAKRWVAANQMREYLRAVERRANESGQAGDLSEWLDWAARKADWLDPTILVSDAILDAPEPEKPGYGYW